jgi:hypothetical protein
LKIGVCRSRRSVSTLNTHGSQRSTTWPRMFRHCVGIVSVSQTVMPMAFGKRKARLAHCGGMP